MSRRESLIEDLKTIVNNRENRNFTTEQVSFYIGSDMSEETLEQWVNETDEGINPVGADDIDALLDGSGLEDNS